VSEARDRATTNQARASDPAASAWVSASAGSGKTHVLVNRVIRLMLAGTPPERILCLTFTRAAAAEMANRLFEVLSSWIALDDDRLTDAIHKLSGHVRFGGELAVARRLFTRALETPGGLKIQTIHAFCEKLLQRFPVEAGVVPGFEVMDERSADELVAEIRAAVLTMAGTAPDSDLGQALAAVVSYVNAQDFDEVLKGVLARRGRLVQLIDGHGGVGEAVAMLAGRLGVDPDATFAAIARDAADGLDREMARRAATCLGETGTKTDSAQSALLHRLAGTADASEALELLKQLTLKRDGEPKADRTLMTKAAATAHPDVADFLMAERERAFALTEADRAVHLVTATRALLTLADAIVGGYEAAKRQRGQYDYDDLIARTLSMFRDFESSAWILYKLDGGIDHILIDEAQDTSPDQWRIVQAIADEFYSGEGAREGLERTLFVVGDHKQSIYSFQGADPKRFDAMLGHFRRLARGAERRFETVDLTVSFRSTQDVLQAVDWVFERADAARGLTPGGAQPEPHQAVRTGEAGLVEIWPVEEPDEVEPMSPWDAPLDRVDPSHPSLRLAEKIAGTIRGWLDRGEILASEGRPIAPGDILVLVRRRDRFVDALLRALKRRGVPVAGADRLTLTSHIAVMDLIALGRFALMPDDDLTLATLLKSPLVERDDGEPVTDDDLFALCHARKGTLWRALREAVAGGAPYGHALAALEGWLARADYTPPHEFLTAVLGPGRGRARFVARLGAEVHDPLDELLRLAIDYEHAHTPSLQGFLDWLTAAETTIKRDMEHGGDEVRVMTVHGAKGLQANVVFLPDTCALPNPRRIPELVVMDGDGGDEAATGLPLWRLPKARQTRDVIAMGEAEKVRQLEEYNRLLYVAMTRARDRLYVCGHETRRERKPECWYDLIVEALKPHAREVALADGTTVLRIERADAAPAETREAKAPPAPAEPPEGWAFRPAAREPVPLRFLAPSRLDLVQGAEADASAAPASPEVLSPLALAGDPLRFKRGTLIHRLLQSLPDLPDGEREAAARRFLAMPAHGLPEAAQEAILREALAVLAHPDFAEAFAPGSMAEVPIAAHMPQADGAPAAIAGRIDRLAVTGDTVLLVDFKTNRPPPTVVDDVPALYLRQLAAYADALARIFPGRRLRAALIWTDGPRLMEVPSETLARAPAS